MGDGPNICQMIGEPYDVILYTGCLKCKIRICPIRKIFDVLSFKFPSIIDELLRESTGETP